MTSSSDVQRPRLTARVLLLDSTDRVLLIHARDPDDPDHHWWELPGGGIDADEPAAAAAERELLEETGILPTKLGPCLWVRDTSFRYRNKHHHRREAVYLAYTHQPSPALRPRHTANERAGLIGHRWWTQPDLASSRDKLLPPKLPRLLGDLLAGAWERTVYLDI